MITSRVQSLSYFDQHYVAFLCSTNLIETISNFSSPGKLLQFPNTPRYSLAWFTHVSPILGNSNYLPVQEHVAFLFDLMELSLNVDGLIDLCTTVRLLISFWIFFSCFFPKSYNWFIYNSCYVKCQRLRKNWRDAVLR